MGTALLDDILKELRRAKKLHPRWPDHVAAQAGIVCEEAGELMQAALQLKYEPGRAGESREEQVRRLRQEAVQTAAAAIRFLENLNH